MHIRAEIAKYLIYAILPMGWLETASPPDFASRADDLERRQTGNTCPLSAFFERGFFMGKFENILLVSGGQRNVGKTTFICNLISSHKEKNVTAVKITPHFHESTSGLETIKTGKGWILSKESNREQKKDTSLYLIAGAKESFFLQSEKESLPEAFETLLPYLPKNDPVIIESAGLIEIIKPRLFVIILPDDRAIKKEMENKLLLTDLIVISDGKKYYPSPEIITFHNKWILSTPK